MGKIWFEIQTCGCAKITASMRVALKDLQPEHLSVIYAGLLRYPLDKKDIALPLAAGY
jgi:hypothetical protein